MRRPAPRDPVAVRPKTARHPETIPSDIPENPVPPSKKARSAMSHSTPSSAALALHHQSALDLRDVLDAVVGSSNGRLIQAARENLQTYLRQDAEDVVQDVFIAFLDGQVPVSSDPRVALLEMLRAVAAEARCRSTFSKRRHKRR